MGNTLNYTNDNSQQFITYSRTIGMFFVILVHLCQQSANRDTVALAQFFITGVTIFMIITGYCYGLKAKNRDYPNSYIRWVISRGGKILIPYYITVSIVVILDAIILCETIGISQLLILIFGIQDFSGDIFYRITGLGHLWYITFVLMSYVLIIALLKKRYVLPNRQRMTLILIILLFVHVVITMLINPKIGRYFLYLLVTFCAFYTAYSFNIAKTDLKKIEIILSILVALIWMLRLYLYFTGHDSVFYNTVFIYYAQILLSVWIVFTLYFLERNNLLIRNPIIEKISSSSYETYLVHYMFIVGPLKIIGLTGWFLADWFIIIIVSLGLGYCLNQFHRKVLIQEK